MIGRLMVPVAGTIAALIAIALAREPRPPKTDAEPFDVRDFIGNGTHEEEEAQTEEEVPLEGNSYRLEVQADGKLKDLDAQVTFASPLEFMEQHPGTSHTVELSKGKGATDATAADVKLKLEGSPLPDGTRRFSVMEARVEPETFEVELAADGVLRTADGTTFDSASALAEQLGNARHTLLVTNGKGVTEGDLDAILAKLREANPRFQVRKVYREPEAPSGEGH